MSAGVVIVGGGLAGQRCAETLRRTGHEGPIRMVCGEPHLPYDRPPLSKELLADASAEERLGFRSAAWYRDASVELLLGVRASELDPGRRRVGLSDGSLLPYDHLLIATGSRPLALPALEGFANATTLRTLEDARALRAALAGGGHLAIVGAGFIGQEAASAARQAGLRATLIEAAPEPLSSLLGPSLGRWFASLHRSEGVRLELGTTVRAARGNGRVESLVLDDGRRVECDHVLVAIGVRPDLEWLAGSGLDSSRLPADADGRTRIPGVYAAGDAAACFDPAVGRHVATGHWEPAARQGSRAARAMLGLTTGAPAPASFWSDLYRTRIQYLGDARRADDLEVDGDPESRSFTATFTRAGRPVAALLVGRPHLLPEARARLAA